MSIEIKEGRGWRMIGVVILERGVREGFFEEVVYE